MSNYQFIIFASAALIFIQTASTTNSTLQLVHILFRHGDRTTDLLTIYPKDPLKNETYYPYGFGELTNRGKQREFQLGRALRARYDQFLGKLYTPDILEALSSNTNRTKMSLQLVLAGLFPPVGEQVWESGLNWQPIPFDAMPRKQDKIFFGLYCPNFGQLYQELVTSPRMQREFKEHAEVFDYIARNSGLKVETYWDLFFLYMCLKTEDEFGLRLPDWTQKVYPQQLRDFAIKSYGLLTATTELRRLTSGYLLKKIIDDSRAKVDGELVPKTRKIFLYSGHELNIAYLLQNLDVFEPHIPPYGAYVAFELHKIEGVHGFKIYYQNYSSTAPHMLKLPACKQFCPLTKFIALLEEYLPEKNSCGGEV